MKGQRLVCHTSHCNPFDFGGMATAYSCCVAITEAKVLGLGCTASGVVIVHKLGQQRLKARVAVSVAESKPTTYKHNGVSVMVSGGLCFHCTS